MAIKLADRPKSIWSDGKTAAKATIAPGDGGPLTASSYIEPVIEHPIRNKIHKRTDKKGKKIWSAVCSQKRVIDVKTGAEKPTGSEVDGYIDCEKNNVREIDHTANAAQQKKNSAASAMHTGVRHKFPTPTKQPPPVPVYPS